MINPSQSPIPDNTQHSQQTNIHASSGIRTHNLSRRAPEDLRLRTRGHWDQHLDKCTVAKQESCSGLSVCCSQKGEGCPCRRITVTAALWNPTVFHEQSGDRNYNVCIISYNADSLFNPDTTFRSSNKSAASSSGGKNSILFRQYWTKQTNSI